MNLINVLGMVNQIEKISFLKILDKYSEENRDKNPKIDKILTDFGLSKADYERMSVEELAELEV